MQLPKWLNNQLRQELEAIEESKQMKYITSVERIGIAKGIAEGMAQGRVEGRVEGESRLLGRLLERRFGALPQWVFDQLSNASEQQLEAWGEALLNASTLDAVFHNSAK
jgi:flagellar biosynthesis/type III secretory pathway protein FliH